MASISGEFLNHVPDELLRAVYEELRQTYDAAAPVCDAAGLEPSQFRWLLPLARRAMFEERLRLLVNKSKVAGVIAREESVTDGNTPYAVVEAGPFFFTASHLDRKGPLPPKAKFRQENSSFNYGLFADFVEPDGQSRYAILTHRSSPDGRKLCSAQVVFPDAVYKGIIAKIDLVARYAEATVVAAPVKPVVTPVEKIMDESKPTLKKKAGQKRKAE